MNPWKQGHYSHLELSEERAITNVKFSLTKQSQACYILFYNNRELHKLTSFYCRLKPSKRTKHLKFSCIFGKILVPFKFQLSGRSAILILKEPFALIFIWCFASILQSKRIERKRRDPIEWYEAIIFYELCCSIKVISFILRSIKTRARKQCTINRSLY